MKISESKDFDSLPLSVWIKFPNKTPVLTYFLYLETRITDKVIFYFMGYLPSKIRFDQGNL